MKRTIQFSINSLVNAISHNFCLKVGCAVVIVFSVLGCATSSMVTNTELTDNTVDARLPKKSGARTASLLSAFFGLDNSLPFGANGICRGAAGRDGMPVIFSSEINPVTMQAGDFRVVMRSGAFGKIHCVSLRPATNTGELRTVLQIGEFGNADEDPPERVEIIGHLYSIDRALDFKGASAAVTPLTPGPLLVVAEVVSDQSIDPDVSTDQNDGDKCPVNGVVQAVRVVWAGGVTLANGDEPGEAERALYKVTVKANDGKLRQVEPVALADLGDGDNNHVLCLGTGEKPVSVSFPADIFTDPNNDLNPATQVDVVDQ